MSSTPEPRWWHRYRAELAVVAIGLVVVVGLWVRNRSDERPSTPGPAATTTVAPATADDQGEVEPVEPVTEGEDAGSLADAVLRADDLPDGWSPVTVGGDRISPMCEGRSPFASVPPAGTARSAFTRGRSDETISGTVARFPGAGQAASLLTRIRDDARACSGAGASYSVGPLRGVGEEAYEITIATSAGDLALRTLVTVARQGPYVAVIVATGPTTDEALALRALKAELNRLVG